MTPCPRCSAPVEGNARFCTECGSWIVHPPTPISGVPIPSAFSAPASFVSGPTPTLDGSLPAASISISNTAQEDTTPQGQAPKSTVHKRTAIKSTPPPPGLRAPSQPPPRTEVGRLSPLASSAMQVPRLPSIDTPPPQSNVAKTLVDTPTSTPAHVASKPKRPLGGFLVSFQYEPLGAYWPLAIGPNLVGRSGVGARPDLDVGFADSTVSVEQAIVHVEPGHCGIEDRGSTNGTFVNGRPLLKGVKAPLNHGDRVRFGSFETMVVVLPTHSLA